MIKYGTAAPDIAKTAEGRKQAVKAAEAATQVHKKKEPVRVLP